MVSPLGYNHIGFLVWSHALLKGISWFIQLTMFWFMSWGNLRVQKFHLSCETNPNCLLPVQSYCALTKGHWNHRIWLKLVQTTACNRRGMANEHHSTSPLTLQDWPYCSVGFAVVNITVTAVPRFSTLPSYHTCFAEIRALLLSIWLLLLG